MGWKWEVVFIKSLQRAPRVVWLRGPHLSKSGTDPSRQLWEEIFQLIPKKSLLEFLAFPGKIIVFIKMGIKQPEVTRLHDNLQNNLFTRFRENRVTNERKNNVVFIGPFRHY